MFPCNQGDAEKKFQTHRPEEFSPGPSARIPPAPPPSLPTAPHGGVPTPYCTPPGGLGIFVRGSMPGGGCACRFKAIIERETTLENHWKCPRTQNAPQRTVGGTYNMGAPVERLDFHCYHFDVET
eukprot:GHVU01032229.1.p1 GENE.GHVU01032229.1~~GHVU01032229.1.p1  ORF type:complete len:125 (-),score=3.56 GHVU01032229.1:214-588(-)